MAASRSRFLEVQLLARRLDAVVLLELWLGGVKIFSCLASAQSSIPKRRYSRAAQSEQFVHPPLVQVNEDVDLGVPYIFAGFRMSPLI